MAELEEQKTNLELTIVKLEDSLINEIKDLTAKTNNLSQLVGNIHFNKLKLESDLERLNESFRAAVSDHLTIQTRLNEIGDEINRKYPSGYVNLEDGTVTYRA
jgi:chromosome segregation ATPase